MSTVLAVAPGRVNLIGEHTDYHGGLCLPFAIALGTTARVTARSDRRVSIASDHGEPWTGTLEEVVAHEVRGWAAYVAGVLWALVEDGWEVPGLDISLTTSLPLGGGLSSSAALECSVATALAGLLDKPLDGPGRTRIAEACRRAETEYVAAPTGGMDQLASMLATPGHGLLVDFTDHDRPVVDDVPLDLAAAGLALVVTDSGVRHELAGEDSGYALRRAEAEAGAVRRLRHVRTENDRVRATAGALEAGAWEEVGRLLSASHVSLRDDYEVSCRELDLIVEAALAAGALGARMTGGGFGGCAIALVHEDRADVVRDDIDAVYEAAGLPRPTHHVVAPAAGARVERQVT